MNINKTDALVTFLFVFIIYFLTHAMFENNQAFFQNLQERGMEKCNSLDYEFIDITKLYPKEWKFFVECNNDGNKVVFKYNPSKYEFNNVPIRNRN